MVQQVPTTPTLNAQAMQILTDFKNQAGVTQENHDVLLDAINSSPFLIEQFNQAAAATKYPLKGLTPLTSANLGGSFNPDNQTITQMHEKAEFVEITSAGMSESHVHDVQITKEAPNYQRG